jgi:predicted nucleotidyltransferase
MDFTGLPLDFDPDLLAESCRRLGIRRLVLFGSRATGTPPPDRESDLDLAISLEAEAPRRDFSDYFMALGDVFADHSLDLAFLADADPLFRWEIMREGVLLWGDVIDFLEYRAFAFKDFVDSADLRALERILSEKKLSLIRRTLDAA